MNKILCFGDGYAANHIWPEWPAIIQALYPDLQHENYGAVGAGDEFIASAVVHAHRQNSNEFFIVQWAGGDRFDKLIQDDSWNHIIDNDPVYHFNRVNLGSQTWWLSSASDQEIIKQYHKVYVQNQQSRQRSVVLRYLVENLLKNQSIFFNLQEMIQYANLPRFAQARSKEIQPSPIVHMCWVEEQILPKMPLQPDTARLAELKKRINQQIWLPYHPDRQEIWYKMSNF